VTRAAFNTTCDLFQGPGAAAPGQFIGTFDCRLVLADAIFLVGADAPLRVAWMTIEAAIPTGSFSAPILSADSALADRVAIPSGTAPQWWVLFTESVLWQTQPIYWRANLVELPAPHLDAIAMETSGLVMQEDTSYILTE